MLSGLATRRSIGIAGACALYLVLTCPGLTQPFLRHREGICATHAVHARNHVIFGLGITKGGNLELGGTDLSVYEDYRDDFYANRPAVSVLGPSTFFWVLGWKEWVYRLNLIVVGLLSILVYSGVARRLLPAPWDLVAVYIFALMPIYAYFSHIANHLDYVILFSLLAWYANLRLDEGPRFRVLLFVSLFLACNSDWPGYFAAFSIAAHRFKGLKSPVSIGVCGLALGCFALHLLHLWWLGPDIRHIKRFLIGGHDRSLLLSPSVGAYLLEESREVVVNFTAAVTAMAVVGGVAAFRERRWTVFFLALLGLEEVVFTYLAYDHDFLTITLVPFAATLAAGGAAWLWTRRGGRAMVLTAGVLAVAQGLWVNIELQRRPGGHDIPWRAAVATREHTLPKDRVLLTIGTRKRLDQYYSERKVSSREWTTDLLCVRYAGTGVRIPVGEDLSRHLLENKDKYDVVVVADLDTADREGLLKEGGITREEAIRLGFCNPASPIRKTAESLSVFWEVAGPFLIYRLR